MFIKLIYQGCPARVDQYIEDVEEHTLPKRYQDKAHGLQQPVDHVEPHRD